MSTRLGQILKTTNPCGGLQWLLLKNLADIGQGVPSSVTRLGDFWTLGNFLKPLATINLPKSPTFLGIFCKGVKIYHFSSEIIFGQLL